jgi:hypothetical protein
VRGVHARAFETFTDVQVEFFHDHYSLGRRGICLGVQQRTQARGLAWQMSGFEERSSKLAKTRQ